MKKYRVNVNGTAYEIELEEMTGDMPSAPAAAPASAAMPASGRCTVKKQRGCTQTTSPRNQQKAQ